VSRLLFNFVSSLMAKGQHLNQEDLWDTSRQDDPHHLWGLLQQGLDDTAGPGAPKVGGGWGGVIGGGGAGGGG
jgi:hypothetical protein